MADGKTLREWKQHGTAPVKGRLPYADVEELENKVMNACSHGETLGIILSQSDPVTKQ